MPLIPAGKRDRRVVIEESTTTIGETGQEIETWAEHRVVMAGKIAVKANERFRSNQLLSEEVVVWRFPYLREFEFQTGVDGKTKKYRINEGGKIHNIKGIAEIGRKNGWEIVTEAVRV